MALSKAEKLEAAATIYEMVISGESDDAIMAALGMDAETYQEAKRFMIDCQVAAARGKSREQVYAEYCMDQRTNIRLVDNFLTKLDEKRHYNATVGAIRLRADLIDKVLQAGFDLGIVKKAAERHELIGGLAIANMSDGDLRKAITDMMMKTTTMVTGASGGDVDIMALEPGELHRGEGTAIVEEDEALVSPAPAPERRKALAPPPKPPAKPASTAKPAAKPATRPVTIKR